MEVKPWYNHPNHVALYFSQVRSQLILYVIHFVSSFLYQFARCWANSAKSLNTLGTAEAEIFNFAAIWCMVAFFSMNQKQYFCAIDYPLYDFIQKQIKFQENKSKFINKRTDKLKLNLLWS